MKALRILLVTLSLGIFIASCEKEENLGNVDNIPGLGGDAWVQGPIDKWLYDTFTVPFNIAIKYKWDQGELNQFLDKTLVPPKEEQVIPVMRAVQKAWINVYVEEAGMSFFKNISPKFFYLLGSGIYVRGGLVVGTAEGGRKIVLTNLNAFRTKGMPGYVPSDTNNVKEVFKTIHHEYGHILDQTVKFPLEFSQSSASSYTSDWLNVSYQDAQDEGFISQYAISKADEDWAEMVCIMLVEGKDWFDDYVNSINYTGTTANGTTAAVARARLRQKESAVVSYFKQAWNIDFYSLQARSRAAVNALIY